MKNPKIKPFGERVLVQPKEVEKVTDSGIIIPEMSKKRPSRGIVLNVSDIVDNLKEGDEVLYGEHAGTLIEEGGVEYLLVRLDEIIAVV